ncbi:peptide ABC transporter substrate-binding protein [soil metagenome]
MKKSKWIGLVAVLAMVLAACGSAEPDETTAPDPDVTTAPDDTTAPDPGEETTTTTAASAPEGDAGQGGPILLLQWQAPSIVNPFLSSGTKDVMAGSLVLEPLASNSPTIDMVPKLAAEIPTLDNGGVAEDLLSITWTLKEDLMWSDGTPVTANDAVFTWEYCTDEATGCSFTANFDGVSNVVAEDDLTIRIEFESETPNPYLPFVSAQSPVLQAAQFADCVGAAANACTEANTMPIGTGPYMVTEFRAEDTVLYEMNPNYRGIAEGKPFFGSVEIKGGGDAAGSARSILEVGDADYGWNLQVEPAVLASMEAAGLGRVEVGFAANMEHINLNQTNNRNPDNPSDYMDGNNPHPLFHNNPDLARAMSMAINREELVAVGYGDTGQVTCNVWPAEPAVSTNNDWCMTQDIEGANTLLDEAGIVDTNGDGIREVDGVELVLDYSTSTNQVRQDFQALIEEYWAEIGIQANMRNADASVFFDGTGNNPDSYVAFLADILMYTFVPLPDPQAHFLGYTTQEMVDSSNNFAGANVPRYSNPEFDAKYEELASTADPDERIRLTIELNDIMINDSVIIPLVYRGSVSAFLNEIQGVGQLNGWDSEYWNIEEWYRE